MHSGSGCGWIRKMLDLQRKRVWLVLLAVGLIIVLSIAAEKSRELVGEEASSKSGQFTLLNCLDMGSGSLACAAREGVKLYVYSLRNRHVKSIRQQATEQAITEALTGGMTAKAAANYALKAGTKAAKLASREAKRIVGPIISSGWDFFEAVYFGGTVTEGLLRGTGTSFGTYFGGYHGEERLGRVGYFVGSHLGSWVGGRVGLMIYDVINGMNYLVQFVQLEEVETATRYESEGLGSGDSYSGKEETTSFEEETATRYESEGIGSGDSYSGKEETTSFEEETDIRYESEGIGSGDSYSGKEETTSFEEETATRYESEGIGSGDSYSGKEERTFFECSVKEETTSFEEETNTSYESEELGSGDSYSEKEETTSYEGYAEGSEYYETAHERGEVSESWGLF
ncbi:uncharacterized protein M6B38_165880 [Iris pallida]|uniref:Uncharacterized protein n=1 Tax=Iris pallida TaxID=29817 RepID=A0AAX6EY25_IRIPA|nr:uncharacterized protein M6B38_165880 [Iris pallida]